MWWFINVVQGFLITMWTVICALLCMLIVLTTQRTHWAIKVAARWLWCPVLLAVCMVRLRISGREHIPPHGTFIYVSNHASLLDIPAVFSAIPKPVYFIAKKELKRVPFMGWAMAAAGMIFIDRANRESAIRSMSEAGRSIKAGKNVISFPEGTRTKTGEVGLFRRGTFVLALEQGISIIPVGISGARACLPSGSFRLRPGVISVHIGHPIDAQSFAHMNAESLADKARSQVLALMKE